MLSYKVKLHYLPCKLLQFKVGAYFGKNLLVLSLKRAWNYQWYKVYRQYGKYTDDVAVGKMSDRQEIARDNFMLQNVTEIVLTCIYCVKDCYWKTVVLTGTLIKFLQITLLIQFDKAFNFVLKMIL